jgi:hypothetical protein
LEQDEVVSFIAIRSAHGQFDIYRCGNFSDL